MPDTPTIEECIDWVIIQPWTHDATLQEATLAALRDYARLKAMLDDPRVVRAEARFIRELIDATTPADAEDVWSDMEMTVAAWDKERKQ